MSRSRSTSVKLFNDQDTPSPFRKGSDSEPDSEDVSNSNTPEPMRPVAQYRRVPDDDRRSLELEVFSKATMPAVISENQDIGQGDIGEGVGKREFDKVVEPVEKGDISFTSSDLVLALIGLCGFVVDIVTDFQLARTYLQSDDPEFVAYGYVTAALVIVPSLVVCVLGLHWYRINYVFWKDRIANGKEFKDLSQETKDWYTTSRILWTVRVVFTILQMGPVWR